MSGKGLGCCTNAFLAELTELTRKHRIVIGGCGCCGSPFVTRIKPCEENYEYVCPYDCDLEFAPPRPEDDDPLKEMTR